MVCWHTTETLIAIFQYPGMIPRKLSCCYKQTHTYNWTKIPFLHQHVLPNPVPSYLNPFTLFIQDGPSKSFAISTHPTKLHFTSLLFLFKISTSLRSLSLRLFGSLGLPIFGVSVAAFGPDVVSFTSFLCPSCFHCKVCQGEMIHRRP